jgi:hypothetical protein
MLKAPAQLQRCGYKEGKCNRCNRMQRASACIALHASTQVCLLTRLSSFLFEFHSLLPFELCLPFVPFLCQQTASNGQQRSFIFVSLVSGFQRAFPAAADQRRDRHKPKRETRQRSNTPFPHAATFFKHERNRRQERAERARRWRDWQQQQQQQWPRSWRGQPRSERQDATNSQGC